MKLSEFKKSIEERIYILKMNFLYSIEEGLEKLGNNFISLLSTLFYNITFVIFINVLYLKVKTIAGFDYDQMLLLVFVGEIMIVTLTLWIRDNMDDLKEYIYSGSLDLLLNKPLPIIWYLSLKSFNIFDSIRNGLPPIIMIGFLVQWTKLNINPINLFIGILIIILGQIVIHCLMFIVSCLEGFADQRGLSVLFDQTLDDMGRRIPGEGYYGAIRSLFLTFFPIGIATGLSSSAILNKIDPFLGLGVSVFTTILFLFIKVKLWNYFMKKYSSASS